MFYAILQENVSSEINFKNKNIQKTNNKMRLNIYLIGLILCSFFFLSFCQMQGGFIALGTGQMNNWDFKISCFPWSSFKIIYLSAANINTDGSVSLRFSNDNVHIPQAVNLGHKAGTKVLLSIGGPAGYPSFSFSNAVKNPQNFVNSLIELKNKYNLDGFDLDWEDSPSDNAISLIRDAIRNQNELANMILTLDVYSYPGLSANTLNGFDYVNVMNYGDGTSLANADVNNAASQYSFMDKSKLLIGVNFEAYGDDSTENQGVTQELQSVVSTYDRNNAVGVFSWNSFDDCGASNQNCAWSGTKTIGNSLK